MKYFLLILLSLALLNAAGCTESASQKAAENTASSSLLPNVEAAALAKSGWTINGKNERLADYKGKVVVLDFWATYCAPCVEEIPHLISLQEKHGANGLEIIGLHVGGDEDKPNVPSFVERFKISYKLGTPADDFANKLFGDDNSIPQTYIFDRQGSLVYKLRGFDQQKRHELDSAIETALKK